MMEIPAGKWCYIRDEDMKPIGGCPFAYTYNGDEGSTDECGHPDFDALIFEDLTPYCPLRCPACLSAYPNGATVTITAKETA